MTFESFDKDPVVYLPASLSNFSFNPRSNLVFFDANEVTNTLYAYFAKLLLVNTIFILKGISGSAETFPFSFFS